MSTRLLEDKTAVITGASAGIGRAAAQVFAAHGAQLVLADIDTDGGAETVALVEQAGGTAIFVAADMTSADQIDAMVDTAVRHFGHLDCAFNNAGINGQAALLADGTEENWEEVIGVNLKGVWLCLRAELRRMSAGGAIVNTASAAGLVGVGVGLSPYVASKHGVVGLTRAAALEYASSNIRINAVCPAVVRTQMLDGLIQRGVLTENQARGYQPLDRLGRPEEIAQTAAWLCSDEASFITGHAMAVDGGMTAG
jgi:NAD(P)-dependent dehydrogenase (short-subunit alcohol dehydrogenase family)